MRRNVNVAISFLVSFPWSDIHVDTKIILLVQKSNVIVKRSFDGVNLVFESEIGAHEYLSSNFFIAECFRLLRKDF